ncbi:Amuc_1101 family PilM-like pilus complex protein [Luteolibacter luteus]|uniref:Type IV pilus assembly protein PilM n=1 Tax=Luteolibacter luteus TaxID=2728835 RepID=A0A858RIT4_9BACT|nr:type IV pilus assembly protein PilM [Luteolibacter luteus]QJE97146.1 type IV pilus assembly protein PilM [Luteolibacter luteus]
MADSQSSIALNIGSQRVSMAVFEPSKNGVVLKAYDSETILADPATEVTRPAQVAYAISQLAQKLKAGRSKARYSVAGSSVFTRFVKLPPLGDDDIEQLVTFEAQQHVPFPLDEVAWDYEILESAGEKEVVIVAIKADALDELNESVTSTGLSTAEVDVAPMALYNAFRAAYPSVSDPVLLIDIGAKTSDLLYIEGKRFFTRSVAMGGVAITTAISKEYGVPFGEAEAHKTQSGLVALGGGHTEQLDETTAALAMTIRNTLGRLPAEIARTTNYYRSQHGGNAPKLVVLAGGGANLPYTKEFFEEKLHLPVEFFNPVSAVSVGKGVDTDKLGREAHLMGELIGLGLRSVGKSAINIDLVPTKVQAARTADKQKPFFIGAAALFLGGLAAWGLLNTLAAGKAQEETKNLVEQKEKLESVANPIQTLFKKEDSLVALANQYTGAEDDRTFWLDLLQEVKAAMSSDSVWITDLEPLFDYNPTDKGKPGKSIVKGEFYSTNYGTSALESVKVDVPVARGQKAADVPVVTPTANAVRIRGFWRDNPRAGNLVYDLLKKLRAEPQHFKFEAMTVPQKDAKGKVQGKAELVELKDEQIVKQLESAPAAEDFAAPFELIIPLSREVPIK